MLEWHQPIPGPGQRMNVAIRLLAAQDIRQVQEIEREAFSSNWPQSSFKRELESRQAACLVAWEPCQKPEVQPETDGEPDVVPVLPIRLVGGLRRAISRPKPPSPAPDNILGFVGMWFMGSEAHITAIAVRESHRGRGIGELLLMGSIEVAMKREFEVVSLEARVSNRIAQSLYEKYGFVSVGIRKAYYSDNRENAVIMTTEPVNTPEYQAKFEQLQEAYIGRHGEISILLV